MEEVVVGVLISRRTSIMKKVPKEVKAITKIYRIPDVKIRTVRNTDN